MKSRDRGPASLATSVKMCANLLAFSLMFLLAPNLASAEEQPSLQGALIVGSNGAGPLQQPLKYGHLDAKRMASALIEAGGFAADEVTLLLEPDPQELVAALDALLAASRGQAPVLFYYSGHATLEALYPGGKELPLQSIKSRLEAKGQTAPRIGILDSCQGGGWTGAKGVTLAEPLVLPTPENSPGEGVLLLASSSGVESAHESDRVKGSYFTHHLTIGLRGAADADSNGHVTVHEAFEYARVGSIRESSQHEGKIQHPSFHARYQGRRDLVLTRPFQGTTLLKFHQKQGPVTLLELNAGVSLLKTEAGQRDLQLAISPGEYLLRKETGQGLHVLEVSVAQGEEIEIYERALQPVPADYLAQKHPSFRSPAASTSVPDNTIDVRFGIGRLHGNAYPDYVLIDGGQRSITMPQLTLTWGLTDRLTWKIGTLGFAYRIGDPGGWELTPWGGLVSWRIGTSSVQSWVASGSLAAGLDGRRWVGPDMSVDFGLSARRDAVTGSDAPLCQSSVISTDIAFTRHQGQVTFNVGLGASHGFLPQVSTTGDPCGSASAFAVGIGSLHTRAFRPVPLVQYHVSEKLSIDGHAALRYTPSDSTWEETYLLGFTRTF